MMKPMRKASLSSLITNAGMITWKSLGPTSRAFSGSLASRWASSTNRARSLAPECRSRKVRTGSLPRSAALKAYVTVDCENMSRPPSRPLMLS